MVEENNQEQEQQHHLDMTHIENDQLESPLPHSATDKMTYNISVITGNRWAAETEGDLYIVLYGDIGISGRIHLRQQVQHESCGLDRQ